ncbi:MAG: beta-N-acetylglucosaminidase domain-containing protein, partial [Sphingomonas sp.]|nr:beta-N-acetylglucosaminidase domain-containing protein [Sphingomonas sp.]
RFFHYAPKGDPWLRRRWTEPYPDAELERLTAFGRACRSAGVRFGVGLSPFEAHRGFDAPMRAALEAKIDQLNSAGTDELGILFDDMEGAELDDLTDRQRDRRCRGGADPGAADHRLPKLLFGRSDPRPRLRSPPARLSRGDRAARPRDRPILDR